MEFDASEESKVQALKRNQMYHQVTPCISPMTKLVQNSEECDASLV